jgi:hypothetical protein
MVENALDGQNGINVYNEKSLHAELKKWYAQPDDLFEVAMAGYIIDLVRGDLLVEIQTGSFSPLKRKLARLAQTHPVRLVFPVAQEKWIVHLPVQPGDTPTRRKSPWRGRVEHVFQELVYIPTLLQQENFSLEVLLIREEEVRSYDSKKSWRKKGWVTQERRLLSVIDRRIFYTPDDLAQLLPQDLQGPFTTRELAKKMSQPGWLAQKMVYCMKKMELLLPCGKRGRSILYECRPLP